MLINQKLYKFKIKRIFHIYNKKFKIARWQYRAILDKGKKKLKIKKFKNIFLYILYKKLNHTKYDGCLVFKTKQNRSNSVF